MISKSEIRIIEILRQMKPMESLIIEKDRQGKIDKYFYKRIEKVWLEDGIEKPVGSIEI